MKSKSMKGDVERERKGAGAYRVSADEQLLQLDDLCEMVCLRLERLALYSAVDLRQQLRVKVLLPLAVRTAIRTHISISTRRSTCTTVCAGCAIPIPTATSTI